MLDPKLLLTLATGLLLLLNGFIAHAAAVKNERSATANEEVAPADREAAERASLTPTP